MKNQEVWEFTRNCLREKIPVALLAVVASSGASPGKAGFKMAVAGNGNRRGTIGGGVMEVNWARESQRRIASHNTIASVRTVFHSKETQYESSGLICSGSQTILLKLLLPDSLETVEVIVCQFDAHGLGRLRVTPSEFSFRVGERSSQDFSFSYQQDNDWSYEENVGVLDTIFIVGSGHVGLALSRVMSTLDFRVIVVDDRKDVNTFVENTFAHQKIHSVYNEIGKFFTGSGREYVAVVTTEYKNDIAALRSVIKKKPKYIGLMGSAAKTQQIFAQLMGDGIAEELLKNIRTPIGIPIASHAPEEIAISIAAEIIQLRNSTQV